MADVRPVDWQSSFAGAIPGLAVYNMGNGRLWGINPSTPFPLASVAKLIIAVAALAAAEEAEPLRDPVRRAISQHDRPATALLLELAGGIDRVNEGLRRRSYEIRLDQEQRSRSSNLGTPEAVTRFLAELAGGQLLTGLALEIVWEALRQQEDQDSLFDAPGRWLHMTGGFEGVCNDVGILILPGRWVVCSLFVSGDPQGDWNELRSAMQEAGHRLYGELTAR